MSTQHLKWLPVIDEERCTGCNRCVEACGPKSLEVIDAVAVLVRPDTCGSEEHCVKPCPEAAIHMAWVEAEIDYSRGRWREVVAPAQFITPARFLKDSRRATTPNLTKRDLCAT